MKLISGILVAGVCFLSCCKSTPTPPPSSDLMGAELRNALTEYAAVLNQNGQANYFLNYLVSDKLCLEDIRNDIEYERETSESNKQFLALLNEPDYGRETEGDAIVRFLYSSDIIGTYAAVTLVRKGDSSYVRVKKINIIATKLIAQTIPEYQILCDSSSYPFTGDWSEISQKLDRFSFWDIRGNISEHSGFDGSIWTIEAAVFDSEIYLYQKVSKWSPEQNSFREACLYLCDLVDPDFGLKTVIR